MIIDDWMPTFWNVLNFRENTLKEYKRLYKKNVAPFIGAKTFGEVTAVELQKLDIWGYLDWIIPTL